MIRNLVIGVGNEMRGDDAAGLLVARRIGDKALPGTEIRESSGDAAALIEMWRDAKAVYVVDCCAPTGEPGRIHRFDAHEAPFPAGLKTISSHDGGLAMAVELARALGELPDKLVVFAIEGRGFEHKAPPSLEISTAVEAVTNLVTREIRHTSGTIAGMIEA